MWSGPDFCREEKLLKNLHLEEKKEKKRKGTDLSG